MGGSTTEVTDVAVRWDQPVCYRKFHPLQSISRLNSEQLRQKLALSLRWDYIATAPARTPLYKNDIKFRR